jgi:hypothetical protein
MKISSYFTDGELEIAIEIAHDILSNKDDMDDISVSYDAGDRLVNLLRKIESYKTVA